MLLLCAGRRLPFSEDMVVTEDGWNVCMWEMQAQERLAEIRAEHATILQQLQQHQISVQEAELHRLWQVAAEKAQAACWKRSQKCCGVSGQSGLGRRLCMLG